MRQVKESQGIGYEQLAQGIGVSFMSVYRWLKKGTVPRNRLVIRSIDKFLARNGYSSSEGNGNRRIRSHRVLVKQ